MFAVSSAGSSRGTSIDLSFFRIAIFCVHGSWPGASAVIVYSSGSIGTRWFHSSSSTAASLRLIVRPSTRLSSVTLIVR